jgi:acyl-CoA synthetase (AMP-forming)/AMP-acid ligase II
MRCEVHDGRRYYYFCGRIKDVVDRGGEKINAEEVEDVLNGHPAILASAVVAMPDPVYGERVCAFVIARLPGAALTLPMVCGYLQEVGLAKFKWPERLEVVDEFPLSASGKLSKKALRGQIAATFFHPQGAAARSAPHGQADLEARANRALLSRPAGLAAGACHFRQGMGPAEPS